MTSQPLPSDFDQLLTVKQVAQRTAISVPSVWRLSKSGDLPQPVRIGRSVRWRASDLQKHIQTA
ncbi:MULTISPECIES: AlpA family transcriptional regulator [unclassified Sulfitobacter]|uniref:helix-turn-helix transcriptional regulator n=1 Tax=unclassified Sulfitobacter TaxID=196795 RepID=UPI0009ED47B4|nr:helix-turn-helix domain-containing protein [Sulfitobacter sp. 15WGC]